MAVTFVRKKSVEIVVGVSIRLVIVAVVKKLRVVLKPLAFGLRVVVGRRRRRPIGHVVSVVAVALSLVFGTAAVITARQLQGNGMICGISRVCTV